MCNRHNIIDVLSMMTEILKCCKFGQNFEKKSNGLGVIFFKLTTDSQLGKKTNNWHKL